MTEQKENKKGYVDQILLNISDFMGKIPGFTRKNRWKTLFGFTLFTVFLGLGLPRVVMDQSMDSFFQEKDPAMIAYRQFRYLFGSDEILLLMYEPPDGDVFSRESLQKVKKLEDELNKRRLNEKSALNRITRVRTILTADYLESRGDTLINRKFIGDNLPKNNREKERFRRLALKHKDYPGSFFSKDSKFGTILIQTDYGARIVREIETESVKSDKNNKEDEFDFGEDEAKKTRDRTAPLKIPKMERPQMGDYTPFMTELKAILKELKWSNSAIGEEKPGTMSYVMAGNPWIMDLFNYIIITDLGTVMTLSFLIIFLALTIAFRSMSAMVWPMLIILLGLVWAIGLAGWLNIVMSMMINIIIILNLTVGIAASIHIISAYKFFLTEGMNREEALTQSFKKTGLPIMLASLTTMAGLFSLTIVPIVPIKNFAMTGTIGIFFTFVGAIFFLPVLFSFWSPKGVKKNNSKGMREENGRNSTEIFIQKILSGITGYVERNPRKIIAVFMVIFIASLSAYPRIIVDTNLAKTMKPGYGVEEAYDAIDKYFGGASSMEVVIDTGVQDGMKSPVILKTMDRFSEKVKSEGKHFIPRTFSLVQAAKESYQNLTDGREANYKIPDDKIVLSQTLVTFEGADPATRKLFVDDDWKVGRLSLQAYNRSSYEYEEFINQVENWLKEYFDPLKKEFPSLKVSLTGGVPLMMKMLNYISINQIKSFALALCVVTLILLVVYGSIRFGLVAMIPNIFPMAIIMGVVGWFRIPLDTDTLLVMPIALGIAVDDTIHILTHYRSELLRGETRMQAIRNSMQEVGQAVMFTSIILSTGFLIFLSSTYIPLNNFGILSAIAIAFALLADLFLLPSLLLVFKPFRKTHS